MRALRLNNLGFTPTNNSTEYSLQAVSATTFAVPLANLPTDFSTPRNNGRIVLQLVVTAPVVPKVGGVGELPDIAPAAPIVRNDAGGDRPWLWIAIATGGAIVASAGAVTAARRLRVPR